MEPVEVFLIRLNLTTEIKKKGEIYEKCIYIHYDNGIGCM